MAYAPASNTTQSLGLTHLATVYYERTALDQLTKTFQFRQLTMPDVMPLRSGKTVQFYRYSLLPANLTPAPEGVVGTGIPLTSTTITATVSEYADYITLSTLLVETALDPITENASFNLGYRAGLTADTITRLEFDSNLANVQLATLGTALGAADLRRGVALLKGVDVHPFDDSDFRVVAHPYVTFDIVSDNTAGGFLDVNKYLSNTGILNNEIGKLGGCRVMESTNVGTTGTAPSTKYFTYLVGKGAVGAISLAGNGPTNVVDPQKQSFSINVIKGGPQIADPAGMIGAAVSYRFVFVVKTLDTTTPRFKIILADSSII